MHLTMFTDYTLRTLLYVGRSPGEVVPASLIAEAYGISVDHTAKAAKWLTQHGYVHAQRGMHGGISLAMPTDAIVIGAVVRAAESAGALLACFEPGANNCPLLPSCRLKAALARAEQAFYDVLDAYTLADLLKSPPDLVSLLGPRRAR